MKKVFCVAYGGGHINIIKHVYRELQTRKGVQTNILALTMADGVLKKEKIPHSTIGDYLDIFECKDLIVKYGYECIKNHEIAQEIKYIDSIVYHGIGYHDLVGEFGEKKAHLLFKEKGRKAFLPVVSMKRILEYENPDVVLITNSPRMEEATGIAANELDIPVVRVNDLPYMSEKPKYTAKVCVMNEWAKTDILNRGLLPSDDIIVTGQPVFEDDLRLKSEKIKEYELSVKKNYDKVILYLGQGYTKEARDIIENLVEIAVKNPNWFIIGRPHPNDLHDYNEEYGKIDNLVFTKAGELKYMLKISDIAVTIHSTSGLQAVLLGTPLVQILLFEDKNSGFLIPGAAIAIDNTNDLENAILNYINVKTEKHVNIKKYGNRSNAAINIANVITSQFSK